MRQIAIEDGQNLIAYCPEGISQLQPRSDYDYLAFMPVRDSQLTILGAKYELTEDNFFFKKVYASNEYIDREVLVTCQMAMWSCCIARTGGRMESLLVLLLIVNLAGLFLIWQRQDKQEKHLSKSLEGSGRSLVRPVGLPL